MVWVGCGWGGGWGWGVGCYHQPRQSRQQRGGAFAGGQLCNGAQHRWLKMEGLQPWLTSPATVMAAPGSRRHHRCQPCNAPHLHVALQATHGENDAAQRGAAAVGTRINQVGNGPPSVGLRGWREGSGVCRAGARGLGRAGEGREAAVAMGSRALHWIECKGHGEWPRTWRRRPAVHGFARGMLAGPC